MANRKMTFDLWYKEVFRVDPYIFLDDRFNAIVDEWHDYQQLLEESYEKNEEDTEQPV